MIVCAQRVAFVGNKRAASSVSCVDSALTRCAVDRLIAALNRAAVEESTWPAAWDALIDMFAADAVHVTSLDKRSGVPFAQLIHNRPAPPGEENAHRQTRIASPLELGAYHSYSCAALDVPGTADIEVVLSVFRLRRKGPFSAHELATFGEIRPNLQSAVATARLLGGDTRHLARLTESLAALGVPALVIGEGGAVAHRNEAAARILRSGTGLSLEGRRLRAADARSEAALRQALESAVEACGRKASVAGSQVGVARPGGSAMRLTIRPLPATGSIFDRRRSWALILIKDPESRLQIMAEDFGLTRAEGEVLTLLAQGSSPREIAAQRQASMNTVRKQLLALLAKSGTRRQAELVALLHGYL